LTKLEVETHAKTALNLTELISFTPAQAPMNPTEFWNTAIFKKGSTLDHNNKTVQFGELDVSVRVHGNMPIVALFTPNDSWAKEIVSFLNEMKTMDAKEQDILQGKIILLLENGKILTNIYLPLPYSIFELERFSEKDPVWLSDQNYLEPDLFGNIWNDNK